MQNIPWRTVAMVGVLALILLPRSPIPMNETRALLVIALAILVK